TSQLERASPVSTGVPVTASRSVTSAATRIFRDMPSRASVSSRSMLRAVLWSPFVTRFVHVLQPKLVRLAYHRPPVLALVRVQPVPVRPCHHARPRDRTYPETDLPVCRQVEESRRVLVNPGGYVR